MPLICSTIGRNGRGESNFHLSRSFCSMFFLLATNFFCMELSYKPHTHLVTDTELLTWCIVQFAKYKFYSKSSWFLDGLKAWKRESEKRIESHLDSRTDSTLRLGLEEESRFTF